MSPWDVRASSACIGCKPAALWRRERGERRGFLMMCFMKRDATHP